jgi:hypothetical protein
MATTRKTKNKKIDPATVTPPVKKSKVQQSGTKSSYLKQKTSPVSGKSTKPRQNRGKKYTIFKLENGKEMVFQNTVHADAYEDENPDIIKETITFDNEAAFREYKAATLANSPVASIPVKTEQLSNDEQKMLAKIRQHRVQHAPSRLINVLFKNTRFSRACVVLFDVKDEHGKPQWNFKAKDNIGVLKAYADNNPASAGSITKEIINNFVMVERRDLEQSEDTILKVKKYNQYILASYFVIPNNAALSTMEEETTYISETLLSVGREIKTIMSTNLYTAALKEVVMGYSENLAKHTFSPEQPGKIPLQQFIQQCPVFSAPIRNYTDYIPKSKVYILRNMLALYDEPIPKYITDEQIAQVNVSEDSDEEEEDATQEDEQQDEGSHPGCAKGFNLPHHHKSAQDKEENDTEKEEDAVEAENSQNQQEQYDEDAHE